MPNEDFLAARLRIFSTLHKEYMKTYVEKKNISYNQYFYLHMINSLPGINQSSIVEIFQAKKSIISVTLKDLEYKGLITQTPDSDNRRSYLINITPEGKEIIDYLDVHDKRVQKKFYKLFQYCDKDLIENMEKCHDFLFNDDIGADEFSL